MKKEQFKQLRDDLWSVADNLRTNSDLKASEVSLASVIKDYTGYIDILIS